MVRVLQIVTVMNFGGLETMIMNYYRKIDRKNIQFDFLVHREEPGTFEEEILKMGGRIYRVPRLNPFSIKYYKALNSFFSQHPYKVVHCHLNCMSAYPLRVAKKKGSEIRIAHAHSKSIDKDYKFLIKIVSKHLIHYYATHLLACGEEAGKWMFGQNKYQVIKNAIDIINFQYDETKRFKLRKEMKIENNTVIGHVGRFSTVKNHQFLINLFDQFCKKNPFSVLWLIGEGEKKQEIQEMVFQKGLQDKVFFFGNRTDVNILYQAMDVLVFPSLYEGIPITLIEAQTASLPCVISRNVSQECIVTNLVQQIGLSEPLEVWNTAIAKALKIKRHSTIDQISKAGFNVNNNVHILENIYGL